MASMMYGIIRVVTPAFYALSLVYRDYLVNDLQKNVTYNQAKPPDIRADSPPHPMPIIIIHTYVCIVLC